MCATSTVGDYWTRTVPDRYPQFYPSGPAGPIHPVGVPGSASWQPVPQYATKEDLEALRKDILELKTLLLAAKAFDDKTGQPDCHMDEKVELIRAFAKMVGVDMNDIFPESK